MTTPPLAPACARCGGELRESDQIAFLGGPTGAAWAHLGCLWKKAA